MLEFDFRARVGAFEVAATGRQQTPRMGLFGPTGCGKTTVLNCLAGLVRPQAGRIVLDGEVLFDAAAGVHVPPHRRRIGYVFQDGRLFPHMSVRRNIVYGRRDANGPDLDEILDVLDLADLLDRSPATLSGGERQRVALARALASGPRLLLLDEPMAMIDAAAKLRILPYLLRSYDVCHVPFVFVSHSLSEVIYLAREVWQMSAGRIEAAVPPRDLLTRSAGAGEAVTNILTGTIRRAPAAGGYAVVRCGGVSMKVPPDSWRDGQEVSVALPARDVILSARRPEGLSARNILPGRLEQLLQEGRVVWAVVRAGQNELLVELTPEAVADLHLRPGQEVFIVLKTHSIRVVPLAHGPRGTQAP